MFNESSYIILHDDSWLEKQRIAGKVVADTLFLLETLVKAKTKLSLIELNNMAEDYIINNQCIPTFKGYKGFPAGVCCSVNKQLVHGIPTNYILQEGDVVKFDLGATFEGAIADSAITCIYGEPLNKEHIRLVETCEGALYAGIKAIKIGNHIGCIGAAIHKFTKNSGFSSIVAYGGHSIDYNRPHAPPFIANKAEQNEGIRIQPGLVIAIEPLLCMGNDNFTSVDKFDNWTVNCRDVSAHFEHSVFVHNDSVEIITYRDNEKYLKNNIVNF